MGRIAAVRYGIGFALNVVVIISVTVIYAAVTSAVTVSAEHYVSFAYITGGIAGFGASFGVTRILRNDIYIDDLHGGRKECDAFDFWKNRRKDGKRVSRAAVCLPYLPMPLISVALVLLMIFRYGRFDSAVSDIVVDAGNGAYGMRCAVELFPCAVMACSAVFWATYFTLITIHYFRATCPHCGRVYGSVESGENAECIYCGGKYGSPRRKSRDASENARK